MKKKGFTLIEIIVAIALISIIGVSSVVTINVTKEKNEKKRLEKFYSQFDEALEVYLSSHQEIYTNLQDNVEGAVITLETLKNEGLVKDNIIDPETNQVIDYENKYYILSDAVLLEDKVTEEDVQNACDGRVEISVINSWGTLKDKVNTSDVIYVCPKEAKTEEDNTIDELLQRIESLEQGLAMMDFGGNSWVLFDVISDDSKRAYWPSGENEDLWVTVNVDKSNKKIKLIYNNEVKSNNLPSVIQYYNNPKNTCRKVIKPVSKYKNEEIDLDNKVLKYVDLEKNSAPAYGDYSEDEMIIEMDGKLYIVSKYNSRSDWINGERYYNYECHIKQEIQKSDISYFLTSENVSTGESPILTKYNDENGWSKKELVDETYETEKSKKKDLYDKINENLKKYITEEDYYCEYGATHFETGLDKLMNRTYRDKFGTISTADNLNDLRSFLLGKSIYVGIYSIEKSFNTYNGYAKISSGNLTDFAVNDNNDEEKYNEDDYVKVSYDRGNLVGDWYSGSIKTANYTPVITISYQEILTDYEKYPTSYKNKYTSCEGKLGTKECPYIIKLDNNILSWGN
ncbi:MAG: type II secretion system protein [Bacilli bacterium]|nr:type II secretion system protein [Bacilli bacterium]